MTDCKRIAIVFVLFMISSVAAMAQEICDNGIDDDGDGLVDCFDPDCSGNGSCTEFFFGNPVICDDAPSVTNFDIALQWGSPNKSSHNKSSVTVGDLDNDGIPEVVTTNHVDKTINVLNGQNGDWLYTASPGFEPENAVAIGNVDDDNCGEIFITGARGSSSIGNKIEAWNCDLTTRIWSTTSNLDRAGNPALADFDQDGTPELYHSNEIINAKTGAIIVPGTGAWDSETIFGSVAVDVFDASECADCAGLELVDGAWIYAINIAAGTKTLIKKMDDYLPAGKRFIPKRWSWGNGTSFTFASVADFNVDGRMDVLISGALGTSTNDPTTIFFWDVENDTVTTYADVSNNFERGTGRINIADMDNDGKLNLSYVSNQKLYCLDENMDPLWIKGILEGSSGFTGCSLFDFDGDGAGEVIYRSESTLHIIDGTDGSTRNSIYCQSRTWFEYPIVADVDGNGASELIVTCSTSDALPFNPYNGSINSQVRSYEAANGERWQPSRSVWNQHAYFAVNINDDLTIPIQQQDHTISFSNGGCDDGTASTDVRSLNTFLNQAPFLNADGCAEYSQPDFKLGDGITFIPAICPNTEFEVSFVLENVGDLDLSGNLPITFYNGDPETASAVKLNTVVQVLTDFDPGTSIPVTKTVQGPGGDFELFIVINDIGTMSPPIDLEAVNAISECEIGNNKGSVSVTSDPFTLTAVKIKDNDLCDDSLPNNGSARAFYDGVIPGMIEVAWLENFEDLSQGATEDTGTTKWTRTHGNHNGTSKFSMVNDHFAGNSFVMNNTDEIVFWNSETIDISGYESVDLTTDLLSDGSLETSDDFIEIYYIIDGGTPVQMTNGRQVGDFSYAQAFTNDISGNNLIVQVRSFNTASNEFYGFDNVRVVGTTPTVSGQFTDGYVFRWYNLNDFSTVLFTGSTYATMADGDYSVVGFSVAGNCFSDTATVNIGITTNDPIIVIYDIEDVTNCDVPNGSLRAGVIDEKDYDGDGLTNDTTTVGYSFNLFLGSFGSTDLVSTGPDGINLEGRQFIMSVRDLTTGCLSSTTATIGTELTRPNLAASADSHVTLCSDLDGGGATATSTDDVTFFWYDGTFSKAVPDFTGATYSNLTAGTYTVIAQDNVSKCLSDEIQVIIRDDTNSPTGIATAVSPNTSCVAGTGVASATGNNGGGATVTGFDFTWYAGLFTSNVANNDLTRPEFSANGIVIAGGTASGLPDGFYTVVITETATGCSDIDTVEVKANFLEPEFTFATPIDTEDAIVFEGKGYIELPQILAGLTSFTVSYWADLGFDNYSDDEREFSSGSTGESQVLLWSDNHNGLAFVVDGVQGTRGRINSSYSSNGWTQVVGSYDAASGDMFLYANGVQIGASNYDGGAVRDTGNPMYIARDGNINNKKFEGVMDEVRIYDKALSPSEIVEQMCRELTGSEDGLIAYYDFNNITGNTDGTVIPDESGNGNNGVLREPDLASVVRTQTADIECPITSVIANTSCDPANPNGIIDISGDISPVGAAYTFRLYEGFSTATLLESNTTGIFEDYAGGFYTVTATDNVTGCLTSPAVVSLPDIPDNPNILATITDDTGCSDTGLGEILVRASSNTTRGGSIVEPTSYTVELYNGANTNITDRIAIRPTVTGSTGTNFIGLNEGTYRIRVINNDLDCESIRDVVIGNNTTLPTIDGAPIVNNSSCDDANPKGFMSVQFVGDPADFTIRWYTGGSVDAANLIVGETGTSINELKAGSYTVVIENNLTKCVSLPRTETVFDEPVFPVVSIDMVSALTNCENENGSLRADVLDPASVGGAPLPVDDYTFQWYVGSDTTGTKVSNADGGNTQLIVNQTSGAYTVAVKSNEFSCISVASRSITERQILPIVGATNTTSVPNTICDPTVSRPNDGIARVTSLVFDGATVTDFTGYTFTWYTGSDITDPFAERLEKSNELTGLAAGAYTVVVENDLTFCESSATTITVVDDLTLPVVSQTAFNNNGICEANGARNFTGSITVTLLADHTYRWFAGQNTNVANLVATAISGAAVNADGNQVSNIPGGTYRVEVTNNLKGCSDVFDHSITDVTTTPIVNATETDNFSCKTPGTGEIVASVPSGSGNYTFAWFNGNSVDSTASIQRTEEGNTITGLSEGTYTVLVRDDATGCISAPRTFEVDDVGDVPDFLANGAGNQNNRVCNPSGTTDASLRGMITILPDSIGADPANYNYTWYDGNSVVVTNINTTSSSNVLNNLSGGTYTVVVENKDTDCTETFQFTITDEFSDPVIPAGSATPDHVTVCEGGTGYPDGGMTVSNTTPGTTADYTYRYYVGASVVEGSELKDNDDIIFIKTGSAGTGTLVSGSSTSVISGLNAGQYTVVAVNIATGCPSAPVTVTVGENLTTPPFAVSVTGTNTVDNFVCDATISGGPTTPNGQITVLPTGSEVLSNYSFRWFDGSGTATPNGDVDNILNNVSGGTYTVEITDNASQCTILIERTINDSTTDPTFPVAAATPNAMTVCVGAVEFPNGSISVTSASITGSGSYFYQYYEGTSVDPAKLIVDGALIAGSGQAVSGATTDNIMRLIPGDYTIVAIESATGCASAPVTVIVGESPLNPVFQVSGSGTQTRNNKVCDINIPGGTTVYNGQITVVPNPIGSADINDFNYVWYTGTGKSTPYGDTDNVLSNAKGGTYTVSIISKSSNCEVLIEHTIVDETSDLTFNDLTVDVTTEPVKDCIGGANYPDGMIVIDTTQITNGSGLYIVEYYTGTSVALANKITSLDNSQDIFTQRGTPPASGTVNQNVFENPVGTLRGLNPGEYTIQVTDLSTGCKSDPITREVLEIPTAPDFSISGVSTETKNNTVCDETIATGGFNGIITTMVNDASTLSSYTYQWYRGTSVDVANIIPTGVSNVLNNIEGGTYTILITNDATKCTTTLQHTINDVTTPPSFTTILAGVDIQDVSICLGASGYPNGELSINEANIQNGVGPYEYEYYFGNSVAAANKIDDDDDIFFQKGLGSLAGARMVNGSSTSTIIGLNQGDYTVVIVDLGSGCKSAPVTVTIDEVLTPLGLEVSSNVAETFDNSVCDITVGGPVSFNGQITLQTNDASNVSDYMYEWFKGAGTNPADVLPNTDSVLEDIEGGVYTVIITSNLTSCTLELQHTIGNTTTDPAFNDPAADVLPKDVTVCVGANGYPDGGITVDLSTIPDYLSDADYKVNYYVGTSAVGTTNLLSINSTSDIFSQKTGFGIPQTETAAAGNNVREVSKGILTGIDDGQYTVTVLDLRTGCLSLPETITVGDDPVTPNFTNAPVNNSVCDFVTIGDYNGSITLATTSGNISDYTYKWFLGQSTNASEQIPANRITSASINAGGDILSEIPGGTYTVEITNGTSLCTNILEITIDNVLTDIPVVDNATPSNVDVCEGDDDYPNGSVAVTAVSGGSVNYSYEWYFGSTVNSTRLITGGTSIFTQKGISGTAGANGLVAITSGGANITGLNAGTYTLRVVDNETGCTSAIENYILIDSAPIVTGNITKINDDFSCDSTTPTGRLEAAATSAGTYTFEWYSGNSAAGDPIGTNALLANRAAGSYTVKIINDATSCFITLTESIERIIPTIALTTGSTSQTNCSPNGAVTVSVDMPLFVTAPVGYTPNFTYQWFFGNTATTALLEGIDPGNGSSPINVTTDNVTGLAFGEYTVIVTETVSGCTSDPTIVTVDDDVSVNKPTISFNNDVIPSDCGQDDGEITATVTANPTGNSLSFEWYEGSADFAKTEATGSAAALAAGDFLVATLPPPATPSDVDDVIITPGAGITGSANIKGLLSGLYTLVIIDNVTGCRYQKTHDLPFVGIQQTTTLTITHVEACPDNGSAEVGLADDDEDGNPGTTVYNPGDADDITQYVIFLYAGAGVPADRFTAYDFKGLKFPYRFNPATGRLDDGDGNEIVTVAPLTPGQNAEFLNLPAGPYTAIAREIPNPAFNPGSTFECWTLASADQKIEDRAFEPIVTSSLTTANSNCDIATFGGNGTLSISVERDAADIDPPSPDGFRFTLYDGDSNTDAVVVTQDFASATATFTRGSLVPKDYLIEIERLRGPAVVTGCITSAALTVQDIPVVQEILSATVQNQTNCDPNNATIEITDTDITDNAADYTYIWYEDASPNPVVIAGQTSSTLALTTLGVGTYFVEAIRIGTGCKTAPFRVDVIKNTEDPQVSLSVVNIDTSCDMDINEGNGSISLVIQSPELGTNYEYQWHVGTTVGSPLVDNGVIIGSTDILNGAAAANYVATLQGIQGNQNYTVEIFDRSNPNNECSVTATIFLNETINLSTLRPMIDYTIQDNQNCVNPNGNILIESVFENEMIQPVANYTFTWFSPAGGDITGLATSVAPGTANQLSDLVGGTYQVLITNTITQCVSENRIDIVISDVNVNPKVQVVTSNDDSFCTGNTTGNGTLEISITENSVAASLTDYSITWFRGTGTADQIFPLDGGNRGSANLVTPDLTSLNGLSAGEYTVQITKNAGVTPNAGCEIITTFTIGSDKPTLTINPAFDILDGDNFNCTNPNGFIEITQVREDALVVPVNGGNYSFTWSNQLGTPIAGVPGTTALGTDNRIVNLTGGTYKVVATNATTQCSTDPVNITIDIDDLQVNPVLNTTVAVDDTFCDNTGNAGDGQITFEIFENGSVTASNPTNFTVTWYRGTTASAPNLLSVNPGTAAIGAPNNTALSGLSAGQYTVVVEKGVSTPNAGCSTTVTYTVGSNEPVLTLEPVINFNIQDNQNCTNENGFIEITSVQEDGTDILLTSLPANYTFIWTVSGGPVMPANIVNANTGLGNRIENLTSGTYSVIARNAVTGCETARVDIIIDDVQVNPDIILGELVADTYCDNGVFQGDGSIEVSITEAGSPANLANYTITWYRGADPLSDPVLAGGTAVINADATEVTGLSTGDYSVVVTKNGTAPNAGCSTTVSYNVGSDEPVLTIDPTLGVSKDDNENCTNPNGSITITNIMEDATNVAVNLTNYTFTWTDNANDPVPSINAGGTGNRIRNLAGGSYTVVALNTVTGCETGMVVTIIDDLQKNPVVQVASTNDDTFCPSTPNTGDGTLAINILEADVAANLSNYTIEWYRGTGVTDQIFPVNGGLRGSANISLDETSLTDLSAGKYTVVITKDAAITPNAGCSVTSTFTVGSDQATLAIDVLANVTKENNKNCSPDENGSIQVNSIMVDGNPVSLTVLPNYTFNWTDDGGTAILPGNITNAGTGIGNKIQNLAAGSYKVTATNTLTACTTGEVVIVIEDISEAPIVQAATLVDDTYCDNTGDIGDGQLSINIFENSSTTASDPNEFTIAWFRGVGIATPLAGTGSAMLGGTNNTSLTGLSAGQYTVVITKGAAVPNVNCSVTSTFTIGSNQPILTIIPVAVEKQNNENCDNPNGFAEVTSVREGLADIAVTPINYTFKWFNSSGEITASAITGTTVAGNGNRIEGLVGDTYTVEATNTTTGCTTGSVITILDDIQVLPIIQIASISDDAYCKNGAGGLIGDGTMAVDIIEDGSLATLSEYTVTWYRGNGAIAANEIYPNNPSALRGSVIQMSDTQLTGLSTGKYTVMVTKDPTLSPNAGCESVSTFTIENTPSILSIDAITEIQSNTNCTVPNGFIEVTNITENGGSVPVTGTNYSFQWANSTGANLTASAVNGLVALGTGNRLEGLASDIYTITATNTVTGCETSQPVQILVPDDKVNPTITDVVLTDNTNCTPGKNGSISITANTADANAADLTRYSFSWFDIDSDGNRVAPSGTISPTTANVSTYSALDSGMYFVEVLNTETNCTVTGSFTIGNDLIIPEIALDSTNVTANTLCTPGTFNGRIVIRKEDLLPSMVLADFNIDVTSTLFVPMPTISPDSIVYEGLEPGGYTVSATLNSNGCAAATAILNVPDRSRTPDIDLISIQNNENCTGGTVSIGEITVDISTFGISTTLADYTIQWYTGLTVDPGSIVSTVLPGIVDNGTTLTGLPGGNYTVQVIRNATGCQAVQSYVVPTDEVFPVISNVEVNNQTLCIENGSIAILDILYKGLVVDSMDLVDNYIIQWADNNNFTPTLTDPDPSTPFELDSLGIGTYFLRVIRRDNQCNSMVAEYTIEDNSFLPEIIIAQVQADSTCAPGAIPNGVLVATADGENSSNTDYVFTWYLASDYPANPILPNSDSLIGFPAGDYLVEVSNSFSGCSSTATGRIDNVNVSPDILAAVATNPNSCDPINGSVQVTSVSQGNISDYTFAFYDTDPSVTPAPTALQDGASDILNGVDMGTYFIIGTYTVTGCTTEIYQISIDDSDVILPEIFGVDSEPQTNCDTSNPNGSLTVNINPALDTLDFRFEWFDPSGNSISNFTRADNLAASIDYRVVVTEIATSCFTEGIFQVNDDIPEPLPLNVSSSANFNCGNPNGSLAVSIIQLPRGRATEDYLYYWFTGKQDNPDIATAFATGRFVNNLPDGDYTLLVVDSRDSECKPSLSTITIEDQTMRPELMFTLEQPLTNCDPAIPNGRVSVSSPSGDISSFSFDWYVGTDTLGRTPFFSGITADSLDAQTYSVVVTSLITGCKTLGFIEVPNEQLPVENPSVSIVGNNSSCVSPNGSARVSISGNTIDYLFEWFRTDNPDVVIATGATISGLVEGTYEVRATDLATGCISERGKVNIALEFTPPAFDVEVVSNSCIRTEDGGAFQFSGRASLRFTTNASIDSVAWLLNGDTSVGAAASNDFAWIDAPPGTHIVRVFTVDRCEFYDQTFTIDTDIVVYNGISNNGDNKNDFFLIDCIEYFPNNVVDIFDRGGQRIYQQEGYDNLEKRFNGTANAGATLGDGKLPEGTYYYIINKGDGSRPIQGYLELVR